LAVNFNFPFPEFWPKFLWNFGGANNNKLTFWNLRHLNPVIETLVCLKFQALFCIFLFFPKKPLDSTLGRPVFEKTKDQN